MLAPTDLEPGGTVGFFADDIDADFQTRVTGVSEDVGVADCTLPEEPEVYQGQSTIKSGFHTYWNF